MKSLKYVFVIGAWLSATVWPLSAQTNPVGTASLATRDGKVVEPDHYTATDDANVAASTLRPTRSERPNLPPAVQAQIQRLQIDRRAYLERQQLLKKRLEGANDKDRATIREQLKELQQKWLEQAKERRKEYKERQEELYNKLKEHRELLDSSSSSVLRESGSRTRRGDD